MNAYEKAPDTDNLFSESDREQTKTFSAAAVVDSASKSRVEYLKKQVELEKTDIASLKTEIQKIVDKVGDGSKANQGNQGDANWV